MSENDLGMLWVIEFEITESSRPDNHPIGAKRSKVYWPQVNKKSHPSAIKSHILASLGVPIGQMDSYEITGPQMRQIVEENILEGTELLLTTSRRTAKTGREYTNHIWKPCS
jgi:hypothetical protein